MVLSSCVSTPISPKPAKIVTDQTFGHYDEDLESQLVLITMTQSHHASLTGMKPVPMSGSLPPKYSEFLDQLKTKYGLERVANWPLATINIFCVVFEIRDTENRETIVAALAQEPGVETAQAVQTFDTQEQLYNDPYLSLQHGVHSLQTLSSHRWSRGKGVRIAVIDTGMDHTHLDLESSSESPRNFVDNDEARFRADTHGTAIGGIIAANADNNTGIIGIAPDASLLALKACWQISSDESQARCNTLTLAKALNYAIKQSVDIINLSLTGPPDPVLDRLVQEALARDIVVIGAMPPNDKKAFPVSVQGTIAVAMPDKQAHSITAPGRRVLSTLPNDEYDFFDGSSFSTAHISGLAALVRSLSPSLTPGEVLALLELTANPDTGAANACRAVEVARQLNDDTPSYNSCL